MVPQRNDGNTAVISRVAYRQSVNQQSVSRKSLIENPQ